MAHKLKTAAKIYSALLTIAKIAVIILIILALYSFLVEDVQVVNVGKPFFEFEGSKLIINVPVTIKNYGFYNISDISVHYEIRNKTTELITGEDLVGNISTNSIDTFDVPIAINFQELYKKEYPNLYHFYNKDILDANITISLGYMLNLVNISINLNHTFQWTPPIESASIYPPNNVKMSSNNLSFDIPYHIKTASYLSGSAKIHGKIENNGKTYGSFTSNIPLGEDYKGSIKMEVNSEDSRYMLTHSIPLQMIGNITIFGFKVPFKYSYHWGAPLENLTYKLLENRTIYYSFTNAANYSLSLDIDKIYYYHNTEVKKEYTYMYVAPGEHVEKYEKITVTQPVDKIEIIFYDENTGISYKEVINL